MTMHTLRKSTLALILALLTTGVGKSLAHVTIIIIPPTHPPTSPTPDDPANGDPDPTGNAGNIVAIPSM